MERRWREKRLANTDERFLKYQGIDVLVSQLFSFTITHDLFPYTCFLRYLSFMPYHLQRFIAWNCSAIIKCVEILGADSNVRYFMEIWRIGIYFDIENSVYNRKIS